MAALTQRHGRLPAFVWFSSESPVSASFSSRAVCVVYTKVHKKMGCLVRISSVRFAKKQDKTMIKGR